jgi:hypothetical protein
VKLPDESYTSTLKATISVTKLTNFVESKGVSVEFKGSLFAFNATQQALNKKNEIKAIQEMCAVIQKIADTAFDFEIRASEPVSLDGSEEKWRIPLEIGVSVNENFQNIPKYMSTTLQGLSLKREEADNYISQQKHVYPVSFADNEGNTYYFMLRSEESLQEILKTIYYFNHAILNFNISNGVEEFQIQNKPEGLVYIYDYGFRVFLKKKVNDGRFTMLQAGSVFYPLSPPFNPDWNPCTLGFDKVRPASVKSNCRDRWGPDLYLKMEQNNCSFCIGANVFLQYSQWLYQVKLHPNDMAEKKDHIENNYTGTSVVSVYARIPKNIPSSYNSRGNEYNLWLYNLENGLEKRFSFVRSLNTIVTQGPDTSINRLKGLTSEGRGIQGKDLSISEVGFVISFIDIQPKKELVRFDFNDFRKLTELQQISGYTIQSNF